MSKVVSAASNALGQDFKTPNQSRWHGFVQPKHNISTTGIGILAAVGVLPMILIYSRMLALPSVTGIPLPTVDLLASFGEMLNQWVSLAWVPPKDRPLILYLLLLPTGALFVVIARLTFGLRVLGLRAILIAIGFQEAGFVPSIILLVIVISIIVGIRPSMRRIRLPLFARISVILCLAALTMIIALLLAPWVRSEAVWGVAFFPVIIVAMVAEGVAKTIANDHAVMAIWRAGWTIVLAVVIALVGQSTIVAAFVIQFPELLVCELIMVIFVSEYFDLRLLEAWPDRLHRKFQGMRLWYSDIPRIALVRNRSNNGVLTKLGRQAPVRYQRKSVQKIVNELRSVGYRVKVLEGDVDLLKSLAEFMPSQPGSRAPGGIVLNFATGVQGSAQFCQIPAMLELAGVPYTGPDPLAHARVSDKFALNTALNSLNLRVPGFQLAFPTHRDAEYRFPLEVSPRLDPDGRKVVVRDSDELRQVIANIWTEYQQDAFVQRVVRGRDVRIGVIGNHNLECLPPLEYVSKKKICPADLDETLVEKLNEVACLAFNAAACRDYARIDMRISKSGKIVVVDVRNVDIMARRGSFVLAAEASGYSLATLIARIVECAAQRYEMPIETEVQKSVSVVPLQRARQPKLQSDQ